MELDICVDCLDVLSLIKNNAMMYNTYFCKKQYGCIIHSISKGNSLFIIELYYSYTKIINNKNFTVILYSPNQIQSEEYINPIKVNTYDDLISNINLTIKKIEYTKLLE